MPAETGNGPPSCFPASGAGVLDVFARVLLGVPRLAPGIHIRLQSEDGFLQTEGFRARLARLDITVGAYRGHIPFQAVAFDLPVAAGVKRSSAILQGLGERASVLQRTTRQ